MNLSIPSFNCKTLFNLLCYSGNCNLCRFPYFLPCLCTSIFAFGVTIVTFWLPVCNFSSDNCTLIAFDQILAMNNNEHTARRSMRSCSKIYGYICRRHFTCTMKIMSHVNMMLWNQQILNKLKEAVNLLRKAF